MLYKIGKIKKAQKENNIVTTISLDIKIEARPGQFAMLWLPGIGEKPYSIAGISPLTFCVAARGTFSKRLSSLKKGDKLWIRGPYGNGFSLKGKNILLIGGGYGFAPLRFLAQEAKKKKINATAVCGARTSGLLLKPAVCKTIYTTDDGSAGIKGNVLAAAEKLLADKKFSAIYSCGPEKMMAAVARLAKKKKTFCQLLLERYMKCGIGICGQCSVGEKLVCCDGPVFGTEILGNKEFEKVWRGPTGRREPI